MFQTLLTACLTVPPPRAIDADTPEAKRARAAVTELNSLDEGRFATWSAALAHNAPAVQAFLFHDLAADKMGDEAVNGWETLLARIDRVEGDCPTHSLRDGLRHRRRVLRPRGGGRGAALSPTGRRGTSVDEATRDEERDGFRTGSLVVGNFTRRDGLLGRGTFGWRRSSGWGTCSRCGRRRGWAGRSEWWQPAGRQRR